MTLGRNLLLLDMVLKATAMDVVLFMNFGMNFLRVREVLVWSRVINGEFLIDVFVVVLDAGSKVKKLAVFKVGLEDGKLAVKVVNSKVVFNGKVVVVVVAVVREVVVAVVVVVRGFSPHLYRGQV